MDKVWKSVTEKRFKTHFNMSIYFLQKKVCQIPQGKVDEEDLENLYSFYNLLYNLYHHSYFIRCEINHQFGRPDDLHFYENLVKFVVIDDIVITSKFKSDLEIVQVQETEETVNDIKKNKKLMK